MRARLLKTIAGPEWGGYVGQVIDKPEKVILALCRAGVAELVDPPEPPQIERAEAKPEAEKAVRPQSKPRTLAGHTKAELYEIATELEIEGRSTMGKAELLEAIEKQSE